MKISVIVPAFNEEKLIEASLVAIRKAMASFTAREWQSELIVCDNNSTDRTAELARAAGALVVFEPVNQIARARNKGAEAAQGEWLVFVDADSHPSPELFTDVLGAIESRKYVFGGSTVRLDRNHGLAGGVVALWNGISRLRTWAAGSFIFCEATAFREIGGFDNQLFVTEEIDLSKRLLKYSRAKGRRGLILHRHPLVTSSRKMHLYTRRDHLRFLARMIWSGGRTSRNRDECHVWYDGRR